MTTFNRVQGDVNDSVVVTLNGVQDLTTVTAVEAHVWKAGATAATLTATVTDTDTREVTIDLGADDGWLSTAVGNYNLETEVTFADGTVLTWPAGNPDTIQVRAQGA